MMPNDLLQQLFIYFNVVYSKRDKYYPIDL